MCRMVETIAKTPEQTLEIGRRFGRELIGGEMILLSGGLGAGKTLFTKGILDALGYDIDEVNSPSFTLVNLYRTERFPVYHIDLWRIDARADAAHAVGLHEILEDARAVTIIEWAERLADFEFPVKPIRILIEGDGDDPRSIQITN